MLKFSSGTGLSLIDWFTPANHANLDQNDLDFGASGPLLVPGTNLFVGGGKYGVFYVTNATNLGHVHASNGQIVQSLPNNGGFIKSGPVYWNRTGGSGPWLYDWSDGASGGDVIKAYHFNGSTFDPSPISVGTIAAPSGSSGGTLTLSANGGTPGTGIVWASVPLSGDGENGVQPGVLRAFNADNLTQELWDSNQKAADNMGNWPKFSPPLVANGRVYTGSYESDSTIGAVVNVYGLGPAGPQVTSDGPSGCNGAYFISWNAIPSATSYQVWIEPPGLSSFSVLKSVTGTNAAVGATNSPQATKFEVQACNGSLCGRLSNTISLSYYKGCP